MASVAVVETLAPKPALVVLGSDVRRFDLPDLDRHAAWFMPRFLDQFKHLSERQAIGFLRSIIYSNEYLFLFQEKGVALAQVVGSHALDADPVIWERFVWAADPENAQQTEAASFFYDKFAEWAKRKSIQTLVIEQATDVPHDFIKARLGRVFSREEKFVKVDGSR